MKFFLRTFGCKSNQYEGQAVREALLAAGHSVVPGPADADVFVLNSCAVTLRAAAACRAALRSALRANPKVKVILTGCAVDLGEAWPGLPAGAIRVPNAKKHAIAQLAFGVAEGGGGKEEIESALSAAPADRFALAVSGFAPRTRGYLKIQDGCANGCAYCAVPAARGSPESRPVAEILAEAARLATAGHAEIVLTGINIGAYSCGGTDLPGLVRRLAATPGLSRLRLGSVEPPYVTPQLVDAMRDAGEIVCPHLHLPLQSGDDGVLAAMRRRYTSSDFLEKVQLLRDSLPHPAITTDVIVCFPGESEAAFARTLGVVKAARFARLHVFPFSPRPGTVAAGLRRLPAGVAAERSAGLIALGRKLAAEFAAGCVGREERIVVESVGAMETGCAAGLTDRYVRLHVSANKREKGEVLPVRVLAVNADGTGLAGAVLPLGSV